MQVKVGAHLPPVMKGMAQQSSSFPIKYGCTPTTGTNQEIHFFCGPSPVLKPPVARKWVVPRRSSAVPHSLMVVDSSCSHDWCLCCRPTDTQLQSMQRQGVQFHHESQRARLTRGWSISSAQLMSLMTDGGTFLAWPLQLMFFIFLKGTLTT